MIADLPGIGDMMGTTRRREGIEADYDDFERACRAGVMGERRNEMGEEIFEGSQGEGARSIVWLLEEGVQEGVRERVEQRRLTDAMAEEQGSG